MVSSTRVIIAAAVSPARILRDPINPELSPELELLSARRFVIKFNSMLNNIKWCLIPYKLFPEQATPLLLLLSVLTRVLVSKLGNTTVPRPGLLFYVCPQASHIPHTAQADAHTRTQTAPKIPIKCLNIITMPAARTAFNLIVSSERESKALSKQYAPFASLRLPLYFRAQVHSVKHTTTG
jgi:hypothetical protein